MTVPAHRALPWDFTPLDAVRRWPGDRALCVLHSGRAHERWSRWSVLAEPAGAWVFDQGGSVRYGDTPGSDSALQNRPFRDLQALSEGDDALWLGSLGYDLGRHVEKLPADADQDRRWPDATMLRCPGWLMHDALTGAWSAHAAWAHGPPDLGAVSNDDLAYSATKPKPNPTRREYEAAVRSVLDYIAAGDVFQVNLTQRFTAEFCGNPRGLFLALAQESPAWYGAYLECPWPHGKSDGSFPALVSTSPELFFELDRQGRVVTRPIKGTRPADTPVEVLRDSAKDAAELAMIVDLLRNDLGRVCAYGSINVTDPRSVERHPTVQHGVATITGRLHPSRSLADLLRAVFPGGSITGAPKVRAMQIIEQLEPVRRGPYCGAIGGVFPAGATGLPHAVFNLAIRTMAVDQGRVDFGVGAGIVADSDPAAEYDETLDKARAMMAALSQGGGSMFTASRGAAVSAATV